jgi:hypothetical protein
MANQHVLICVLKMNLCEEFTKVIAKQQRIERANWLPKRNKIQLTASAR